MSPEISPKVQRPESHQKDGKSMPPGERPKDVEIGQKGKKTRRTTACTTSLTCLHWKTSRENRKTGIAILTRDIISPFLASSETYLHWKVFGLSHP
jgi:hypothetical protein